MTVKELAESLQCKVVAGANGMSAEITNVYIGDLLSWVMGNAKADCAWITILGHINIIAVASLVGVSCVIIAEGAVADDDTIMRAESEDIPILLCSSTAYNIAKRLVEFGI